MKKPKWIFLGVLSILLFYIIFYFNINSPYNYLTAKIGAMSGNLIYPQCEYQGQDLDRLNRISETMNFKVEHVDCDIFYTRGMDVYYEIMAHEISELNGKDWLSKLDYDKLDSFIQKKQGQSIDRWNVHVAKDSIIETIIDTVMEGQLSLFKWKIVSENSIDSIINLLKTKERYILWGDNNELNKMPTPKSEKDTLIMNTENFKIFELANCGIGYYGMQKHLLGEDSLDVYLFGYDELEDWNDHKAIRFTYVENVGVLTMFGAIYWKSELKMWIIGNRKIRNEEVDFSKLYALSW